MGANPVFFDVYLKYDNSSNLLPLPAQISVAPGGTQANRNLQRRFFLVDAVSAAQQQQSGRQQQQQTASKYIRYAKSITIQVDLSGGQVNGQIYPPVFYVTYDFVSTSNMQSRVEVQFQISYTSQLSQEMVIVGIVTGVFVLLSFFWAIFRTWIWNKRSGKLAPDLVTLFKFVMFWFSALSNVLFLIMVALSLYWLIIFKVDNCEFMLPKISLIRPKLFIKIDFNLLAKFLSEKIIKTKIYY